PAVVFPHGPMGVSAGEPVWDLTQGRFGPFAGQVFVSDFGSLILRVNLEKISGAWQGSVFSLISRNSIAPQVTGEAIAQGSMRLAFAPDGSLYVAQTAGWGAGTNGLQRISWDGKASTEVKTVRLTARGFTFEFTEPMEQSRLQKPAHFQIQRFRFYYQAKYGSPWVDQSAVPVREVIVSADGRKAEVIVEKLEPGFVYEFSLGELRSAKGEEIANPIGYYTANRLVTGEIAVAGTTRLPQPGEDALGAKEAEAALSPEALVASGQKIYALFCSACHQPDGRGLPGGAANFVDDLHGWPNRMKPC
ncbi:MAG TPA: cytochrome c, partial [Opitutaceae bacterium]|nr:cytochrome c [Opitutaceae bacterium]